MKQSRKAAIELVDNAVGDSYSVKKGLGGAQKIRAGGSAISTGGAIARWALVAAAADGPLPIGDIVAAGILIGGGAYMVHEGYQDMRQK
ncbi:MAG: putative secreted protein [Circular genetic element sp.]|nr:MAG: putative secreted protein [Circular genetic element sp.]